MKKYFVPNNLSTNSQFGFRKGISTENGVSTIIDSISHSFDQSNFVGGVFLDLAKPFDTKDRNILFRKLDLYGVKNHSNSFLKIYFTGRQQYTNIEQHDSTLQQVEKGIAQGRLIGPLMFLIHINDIVKTSNISNFSLDADDC